MDTEKVEHAKPTPYSSDVSNSSIRVHGTSQASADRGAQAVAAALARKKELKDLPTYGQGGFVDWASEPVEKAISIGTNTPPEDTVGNVGEIDMPGKSTVRRRFARRQRQHSKLSSSKVSAGSVCAQVIMMCISIPLILGLGLLLGWHCYLIWKNRTTI